MPPPSPDAVRAWLVASCAAQGVPVVVRDVVVLARVAVLVSGAAVAGRGRVSAEHGPADRSQSPDGLHPVQVQGAGAGGAGADHGVVEQGPDDGDLPVQVQSGPLSA